MSREKMPLKYREEMANKYGELMADILTLDANRTMTYHAIEDQFKIDGNAKDRVNGLDREMVHQHEEVMQRVGENLMSIKDSVRNDVSDLVKEPLVKVVTLRLALSDEKIRGAQDDFSWSMPEFGGDW